MLEENTEKNTYKTMLEENTEKNSKPSTHPVDQIFEPYDKGIHAVFLSGRSLRDVELNIGGKGIRPLSSILSSEAAARYGMGTARFNLATGSTLDVSGYREETKRNEFMTQLRRGGLADLFDFGHLDQNQPPHLTALEFLRRIHQAIRQGADSNPIPPLLLLWEFGEDIVPNMDSGGLHEYALQVAEMIQLLAADPLMRSREIFLIFSGRDNLCDERVLTSLYQIRLPQPERTEKRDFLSHLLSLEARKQATFEAGIDIDIAANLTARTPNTGIDQLVLSSAKTGSPIQLTDLIDRKTQDIVAMSENTLSLMDTRRVEGVELVGRNVEPVLNVVRKYGQNLRRGGRYTPQAIILAGAPSTGKTDLALIVAKEAGVSALELHSPKGSLVGETERRAELQQRVLAELTPCVGFVDEITEAFPMQRGGTNLDSGASDAVVKALLQGLSDKSREGRSIVLGTSNMPWKLGSALESRFTFLPVISALPEDYPDILCAILRSLNSEMVCSPDDEIIKKAASLFYEKGAVPRRMRGSIGVLLGLEDVDLSVDLVLEAARSCAEIDSRTRFSNEFADLAAIKIASNQRFYPWYERADYPVPSWLRNIVKSPGGELDRDALDSRMEELKPHVNV